MTMTSTDVREESAIRVELDGHQLIVTMSDTAYRAVFHKHPDEPRLIAANGLAVDRQAPIHPAEFEDLAWRAANSKARELNWVGDSW
jgi:hypothetical protein